MDELEEILKDLEKQGVSLPTLLKVRVVEKATKLRALLTQAHALQVLGARETGTSRASLDAKLVTLELDTVKLLRAFLAEDFPPITALLVEAAHREIFTLPKEKSSEATTP